MGLHLTVINKINFGNRLFLATVALPTFISILYFGIFASDVYISESHFVVRSPHKPTEMTLGSVLSGGTLKGASEENDAVVEYLQSRSALDAVNHDGFVRKMYESEDVSWFDRFGGFVAGDSKEELYRYFLKKVVVAHNPATMIDSLTVRAYDPKDARALNERLLEQSETLVNQLSKRAREDAIEVASEEVEEAKMLSKKAELELARYRSKVGLIDPELEAPVRIQMISKLQDELIAAKTKLLQVQTYTPRASQIPFLKTQIQSLQREIDKQTSNVFGGNKSLSTKAPRYQELLLNTKFAEKQLAVALTSLEEAEAEARRKRAYVERIAAPNLPDYPLEPRRIRGILATLLLGLLGWGIISVLITGIREHRD